MAPSRALLALLPVLLGLSGCGFSSPLSPPPPPPPPAASCNVTQGLRVDGNDIGNATVSSAAECCALCRRNPRCLFFTFVASHSLCWLKTSGAGMHHSDADCTSGSVKRPCGSVADCSGAGTCDVASGSCSCSQGWTGDDCGTLALTQHAFPCGKGGLCQPNLSSWGGNAVYGDDGKWHMFSAVFSNQCPLEDWLTNSNVLHSVADSIEGPYIPHDIALGDRSADYWDGVTQHNPDIQRAPDGTYLLFYMGATANNTSPKNCTPGVAGLGGLTPVAAHQRIGVATAKSPYGPWTRPSVPTFGPEANDPNAKDSLFVTNPSPIVLSNGTILLIYKGRSINDQNNMYTLTATAENYTQPFVRFGGPIQVPTNCEDAGGFFDNVTQTFRMNLHCYCNTVFLWSKDGRSWVVPDGQQEWCHLNYVDGTTGVLQRRERPKWVRHPNGTYFIFTSARSHEAHNGRTFTLVTRPGA